MKDKINELLKIISEKIFYIDGFDYKIIEDKIGNKPFIKIVLPPKGKNIGVVIGKQGANLFALNRILSIWAYNNNCFVKIIQLKSLEKYESITS